MSELYHHGIQGQKWGVRHGPPYPLKSATSNRIQKHGASSVKSKSETKYGGAPGSSGGGGLFSKIKKSREAKKQAKQHASDQWHKKYWDYLDEFDAKQKELDDYVKKKYTKSFMKKNGIDYDEDDEESRYESALEWAYENDSDYVDKLISYEEEMDEKGEKLRKEHADLQRTWGQIDIHQRPKKSEESVQGGIPGSEKASWKDLRNARKQADKRKNERKQESNRKLDEDLENWAEKHGDNGEKIDAWERGEYEDPELEKIYNRYYKDNKTLLDDYNHQISEIKNKRVPVIGGVQGGTGGLRAAIAKHRNAKVDKSFKEWKDNDKKKADAIDLGKKRNDAKWEYEQNPTPANKQALKEAERAYQNALKSNTTYRRGSVVHDVEADMSRKYLSAAKKLQKEMANNPTKEQKKQYNAYINKHAISRDTARNAPAKYQAKSNRNAALKRTATMTVKGAAAVGVAAVGIKLLNKYTNTNIDLSPKTLGRYIREAEVLMRKRGF